MIKKIMRLREKHYMVKASFTIEAAVVVPICLVVIMSAIITVFNFHDSVVLKAAAASVIPAYYLESENNGQKYIEEAKEYFNRRLIILKNAAAESVENNDGAELKTSGELNLNMGIAETILESSLGNYAEDVSLSSLNARENLIKYKVLCDTGEKIGLVGGEE